jgi:hypothetical protein
VLEMLPNRGGCTTLPNCLVSPSICSHPFLVLSMSVECDWLVTHLIIVICTYRYVV